ncbi:MAG: GIY-YIG nuclease family protein [Calditrichaeota bacterium]|nr:MAG: GIY-YIG nuclease family protein [Calditrichota bacterium]
MQTTPLNQIPANARGTYALILSLPATHRIRIGRLGTFEFGAGDYLYVGSALGPGGLRARLRHHLRPASNPRWHLDYLRPFAIPEAIGYVIHPERLECTWAFILRTLPGISIPVPGFGASDCNCSSHLFFSHHFPGLAILFEQQRVQGSVTGLLKI